MGRWDTKGDHASLFSLSISLSVSVSSLVLSRSLRNGASYRRQCQWDSDKKAGKKGGSEETVAGNREGVERKREKRKGEALYAICRWRTQRDWHVERTSDEKRESARKRERERRRKEKGVKKRDAKKG